MFNRFGPKKLKHITPDDQQNIEFYWQGQQNQEVEVCGPTTKNNIKNDPKIGQKTIQKSSKIDPRSQKSTGNRVFLHPKVL